MKSRTQGSRPRPRPRTQKNPRPRPRTVFPRTDTLGAKDRNARGQEPRTQTQVLSKQKKKVLHKKFSADLRKKKKKRSSQKFFRRSPQKNVFQKIFQALHKILTIQKILLFSSRSRPIFEDLRLRGQELQNVSSTTPHQWRIQKILVGGDLKHKTSKIRMSSPKLRLIFRPKSEIQTFFSPKFRWSPKKKKGLHQN